MLVSHTELNLEDNTFNMDVPLFYNLINSLHSSLFSRQSLEI